MSVVGCSHTTWLQPRAPQELKVECWVSKHRGRRQAMASLNDGLTARQSEHELVVDPLTIPAASPSERRRVRVSQRSTTHSLQPPASTSTVEPRSLPPAAPSYE